MPQATPNNALWSGDFTLTLKVREGCNTAAAQCKSSQFQMGRLRECKKPAQKWRCQLEPQRGLQTLPASSHGNVHLQIWGIAGLLPDTPPGVIGLSQWKELHCAYRNNYVYN